MKKIEINKKMNIMMKERKIFTMMIKEMKIIIKKYRKLQKIKYSLNYFYKN
jgi:hypothetical protein